MARCLFSKYCDLSDGGGETAGMLSSSGPWVSIGRGAQRNHCVKSKLKENSHDSKRLMAQLCKGHAGF